MTMAKKTAKNPKTTKKVTKEDKKQNASQTESQLMPTQPIFDEKNQQLPEEAQEKMKEIQKIMDVFKEKLVDRFEGHISGISLLPPHKILAEVAESVPEEEQTKLAEDHINTLVLVDDTTPTS